MTIKNTLDYAKIFDRLCHFVALSRDVNVDTVVDNLLMSTFAIDDELVARTSAEVAEALAAYFSIHLSENIIDASIDRLLASGELLTTEDGVYYLPTDVSAEITRKIEAASELERQVREEWFAELSKLRLGIPSEHRDQLWKALKSYLAKAFHRHGAQTVQLLDPRIPIPPEIDTNLSLLLGNAIKETGLQFFPEAAKAAIRGFLRNQTPNRTKYLAQLIDGTFSFFALSADEATSAYLRGAFQPMAIFLDTNFIFGILNLHNNPLVSVSRELVSFISHHSLPFTLYYHAETLGEMKRTVYAIGDRLRASRWARPLSRAAMRSGEISGLELRYHELNAEKPIDVEAFLSMYERPEPLLRDQGFKIFREARVREDDIKRRAKLVAEYQAFIEERRRRPKPYAAYDHDMVVWLATRDRRVSADSILEAGALFLTCDYYLYLFDQKVLREEPQLGMVVMPNHFLQMLRPLVPATDDFDRRFVETFAIPEFRVIGSDYSATVSKVLSYLATYSSIPEETAVHILADELLIQRLKGVDEDSEEFRHSVDNAVAKENERLLEEIAHWKLEAEQAMAEKEEVTADAEVKDHALAAKDDKLQQLEQAQNESHLRFQALQAKMENLESAQKQSDEAFQGQIRILEEDHERITGRWRLAFGILFVAFGLAIIFGASQIWDWPWLNEHSNRLGLYGCAISMVFVAGWAIADPKRRNFAFGAFGLGVLFVLLQILGSLLVKC